MNLNSLRNQAVSFAYHYPVAVAAIVIVLLIVAYKKPKESFKFALVLLFVAAGLYAISLFGDTVKTGSQNKDQMVNKTRELVE